MLLQAGRVGDLVKPIVATGRNRADDFSRTADLARELLLFECHCSDLMERKGKAFARITGYASAERVAQTVYKTYQIGKYFPALKQGVW